MEPGFTDQIMLLQSNKATQRKLFDRVSENYAHLLLDLPSSGFKEVLLRIFPSLLSQALYTSFCACFPQSWFGSHEFKSFVCDTMHQWIGGTLPNPKSYMNWNYFELEPERFRREEMLRGPEKVSGVARQRMTAKLSKAEPQYKRQRQASKKIKEITELRLLEKAAQNESHPACRGPEFSKNMFSITGKSPLIVHYLQQHHAYQQTGQDILMTRREVSKTIPYPYCLLRYWVVSICSRRCWDPEPWEGGICQGESAVVPSGEGSHPWLPL
ncbi:protein FAM227A-like isoform 2-T2 [Sarcophilus harrisii]